ncbi:hypothetical protein NKH24_13325 [Mesorhizobium sp. M1300]|uniref:hypothetical protein n=1 Tax=Mesorhizobium sp. M1300 TaxID=2957077 RepID=UPI00333C90FB
MSTPKEISIGQNTAVFFNSLLSLKVQLRIASSRSARRSVLEKRREWWLLAPLWRKTRASTPLSADAALAPVDDVDAFQGWETTDGEFPPGT